MKVRATFDGTRRSYGFEPGKEYELEVKTRGQLLQVTHCHPPRQQLPYASWDTFLDNWLEVTKLLPPGSWRDKEPGKV